MNMRFTPCNLLVALLTMTAPVWLGNFKDSSAPGASSAIKAFSSLAKPVTGQPSGGPVEADVLSKIYQDISRQEYNVSYDGAAKTWQSPNRAQNIRTYYTPGHWKLQNRRDSAGHNWKLDISTLGVYADGQRLATASAAPQVTTNDNKIEFAHPAFTEQYLNTPEGVRQNFIIKEAPAATETVTVKLQVSGMKVTPKAGNAAVLSGNGQQLTYSGLKAWDADGKAVKAALQADHQTIALIAYTDGAHFPVTIDPIVANGNPTNANATLTTTLPNTYLGYSVSGAGDVNGDGYSDVIVGAYGYDNGTTLDAGAAFVYHGSATGVSTTAAATLTTTQPSAQLGYSVSGAGDVNGDGYSDVIVGAYYYGTAHEGVAFVYHGSATGVSTTAAATLTTAQSGAFLGWSVSGAGDVNGDGYSDVIVGAPSYDNGAAADAGAAFVYHGSATGVSTTVAATLTTTQGGAYLGYSVSGAGDVNGDGYSDVVAGAELYDNGAAADAGAAFVYQGSATGVSTTAAATLTTTQGGAYLGSSVSGAGDVNGDGYSDIIIGAYKYDNGAAADAGAAFVYHGSATGVSTTAAATLTTTQGGANLGYSVSGAGDVNGDGYSDVIVGAIGYTNGELSEGAAFVYQGSASGVSTTAAAMVESNQGNANLGSGVSGAGDVNGDGYSDVIVGAYRYDNGAATDAGAAFVYHGSASGVSTTATTMVESNLAGAQLGFSVANAGDVNGDGYSDVIVGAPLYDNGAATDAGAAFVYHGSATGVSTTAAATLTTTQGGANFGWSVSGAGDVNGDGYSDVIVGAYQYNNGAATSAGAAFVYHGSATGVSTTAAATLTTTQGGAQLGTSVSGAGDVNGDGYSDVIVGAPNYSNVESGEGAFYVYRGSSTGINTVVPTIVESNVVSAHLGNSVSGAGDVNGDGYSDVIVGAYQYNNGAATSAGAAFVYHGSAGGISTTAAATLTTTQAGANLGNSVSAAGDVNGDGYSDVIVGAPLYNNGAATDAGAAFVYHGSATGVSTTAAATLTTTLGSVYLGYSVSGAGDVNGDGYSDVIAGAYGYDNGAATDAGAAFVYHGSATGVSTTAAATLTTTLGSVYLGYSVSGAGDVNGDGYSDVIAGAYGYSNIQSIEGAFFIYQGNNGGGLRKTLRLFNTSTTTPIQQSNISVNNFAIGLFARNPDGRSRARLVWQTRGPGQSFSTPITTSTAFTAQQASYTSIGTTGTQLTSNVNKVGFQTKVRVRIKYDLTTSQNGEVYSPWIYPQDYFDIQGMSAAPLVNPGVPLPVTLVSFTATPVEKARVQLDWQTASQINNDFFTVERSKDAQNWETVTVVKGAGNSSALLSYAAFDDQPYAGVSYYRLKQTDYDGRATYSAVRTVNLSGTETQLQVNPNPARSIVTITAAEADLTRLQLFNSAGQDVTGLIQLKKISNRQLEANISRLAPGVYYLKTTTATGKLYKQ